MSGTFAASNLATETGETETFEARGRLWSLVATYSFTWAALARVTGIAVFRGQIADRTGVGHLSPSSRKPVDIRNQLLWVGIRNQLLWVGIRNQLLWVGVVFGIEY